MKCARCPTECDGSTRVFLPNQARAPLCDSCARPVIAHVTSTPTMTVDAMTTPFPVLSRGKVFQAMTCPEMYHPSWWSFLDELETRELWWTINPGDVVLDVGADFGSYTLSALAQGAAVVLAWSPPFKHPSIPVEAITLQRSIILNGWEHCAQVSPKGLYSKHGYLAAFDGPRPAQYFETHAEALKAIEGQPGNCATFEVDTIDSLNVPKCDWIKLDVEGCELEILKGAAATIALHSPKILLEHHYHIDPDCERKCDEFLLARGHKKQGTRPHHTVAHSLYLP